jgi:drug/metabolite transporter (DMT)-like permease
VTLTTDNHRKAIALAAAAVLLATIQDSIVKSVSGSYPAYEAMMFRGFASTPVLAALLLFRSSLASLKTPFLAWLLLRGLVLASAYLTFILSIATLPIANALAIYFSMPFIVAALSKPFLGEHVPWFRWVAMASAFVGVLAIMRPGTSSFEPASLFALWSAFGYAIGQMMGRHMSGKVPPLVVANIQNAVYLTVAVALLVIFTVFDFSGSTHKSLAFLTRPFAWPTQNDFLMLLVMGLLSSAAMLCFISAYNNAPANFVAPFEYSGIVWAMLFGIVFFNDIPDSWTTIGIAIIVIAGLWMLWMDRRSLVPSPLERGDRAKRGG